MPTSTIKYAPFCLKQRIYINKAMDCKMSVAEGSIRSSKTIMHCIIAAMYLDECPDKIHLASGSTIANAKLNIGDCNGFGIEHLFRGRCKWGKYKDNECLYIHSHNGLKILIFAGGGKADSYKKILGNSYGLWIATEINEHYDSDDSRESFIKVAFGRQTAAIRPVVLWDLNPCNPNHKIYKEYIDKYQKEFVGGYNYQHFTLHDNLSITPQRLREIESQYNPNSVWYKRDILGMRCSAEGLCFQEFADDPERCIIDKAPPNIASVICGVDFGGMGSQHTFVAIGITTRYQWVVALKSKIVIAKGMDAEELGRKFADFCWEIINTYGKGIICYCDSAEQTLINQLTKEVYVQRVRVDMNNAAKTEINSRIRLVNLLVAQGRLKIVRGQCDSLINALSTAVWDKKQADIGIDCRLDNGTSDIDTCDAFEYTIENYREELINAFRNNMN